MSVDFIKNGDIVTFSIYDNINNLYISNDLNDIIFKKDKTLPLLFKINKHKSCGCGNKEIENNELITLITENTGYKGYYLSDIDGKIKLVHGSPDKKNEVWKINLINSDQDSNSSRYDNKIQSRSKITLTSNNNNNKLSFEKYNILVINKYQPAPDGDNILNLDKQKSLTNEKAFYQNNLLKSYNSIIWLILLLIIVVVVVIILYKKNIIKF